MLQRAGLKTRSHVLINLRRTEVILRHAGKDIFKKGDEATIVGPSTAASPHCGAGLSASCFADVPGNVAKTKNPPLYNSTADGRSDLRKQEDISFSRY